MLLRKHLTRKNADRLLRAAEYASKSEVQLLIAREFPKPDVPARLEPVPINVALPTVSELVPEPVEFGRKTEEIAPPPAPVPESVAVDFPRMEPLAPQRFALQVTISQEAHDKLRRAQELLGQQISPNDLESLLDCVLDIALPELEKRKFAATDRPQPQKPRQGNDPPYVPNAVKREVWKRDGGQCTFRGDSGQRCTERSGLEFDHIEPVARGGAATVRNTRLLCPAHNQYEAERVFGAEFVRAKRERATATASG